MEKTNIKQEFTLIESIDVKELKKALANLKSLGSKSILHLHDLVVFDIRHGYLVLKRYYTNDVSLLATYTLQETSLPDGSYFVDIKYLQESIKHIKSGSMKLQIVDDWLRVYYNSNFTNIKLEQADQFEVSLDFSNKIECNLDTLIPIFEMFLLTLKNTKDDVVEFKTNAILKMGKGLLSLAATDAIRLIDYTSDIDSTDEAEIFLNVNLIKYIVKKYKKLGTKKVFIFYTKKDPYQVSFYVGTQSISSTYTKFTFPQYKAVIPPESMHTYSVRLDNYISNQKPSKVIYKLLIDLSTGTLTQLDSDGNTLSTLQTGAIKALKPEVEPFVFAVNHNFLLDMYSNMPVYSKLLVVSDNKATSIVLKTQEFTIVRLLMPIIVH